jgi:hypothetical protein
MRKFFKPSTYIWIIVFGVIAIVYFGREILGFTTKDLVRCADQFIVRGIKYDDKISFEAREGLKKIDLKELASKNVKEKSKNDLWLSYYRDCENMKKTTPSAFNLQYSPK